MDTKSGRILECLGPLEYKGGKHFDQAKIENDIKLFEQWLSEIPPEEASKVIHEFKALNDDLDIIFSKLLALEPVQDKATALPLVNQWIAIANEILKNSR